MDSIIVPGLQKTEQRGAQITDVKIPGRTGRETGADGTAGRNSWGISGGHRLDNYSENRRGYQPAIKQKNTKI